MTTVIRPKEVCILDGDEQMDSILNIVRKRTGRRKSGTFRLNLLSGRASAGPSVVSDICVKFSLKPEDHVDPDDPVLLDDLLHADLPWSGNIVVDDGKLDYKYIFSARVRNVVHFNKFIFQLRELCDGKPHSDGLVHWNIYNLPEGFTYDIKSGLKQMEVVESFQDYYEGVKALELYLTETGYIKQDSDVWHMLDDHDQVISKIDIALLGVMFFNSLG